EQVEVHRERHGLAVACLACAELLAGDARFAIPAALRVASSTARSSGARDATRPLGPAHISNADQAVLTLAGSPARARPRARLLTVFVRKLCARDERREEGDGDERCVRATDRKRTPESSEHVEERHGAVH